MPKTYVRFGIRFQYPDNWTLEEEASLEGAEFVSVNSPAGAFWSVAVHPAAIDPGELCESTLAAMREEYDELDAEPLFESLGPYEAVGYVMNFYCLDLTNTAQVRSFRTERATYLLMYQAEDRDFDTADRVFRAITHSLLSG